MNEEEIPTEFRRIGLSSQAVKQQKYQRWAEEMARNGWDVREPTPKKIKALALEDAVKRMEAAGLDVRP